jgi:hypothetical protein
MGCICLGWLCVVSEETHFEIVKHKNGEVIQQHILKRAPKH